MKEVPLREWAKRLLEDQIDRLGELRNANPRDQSFKLWRQTTLTVIQRLWPGNASKSEAFRRVAFTTPSARATRNQVRQHYDRGCAEAVSYLRTLMLEIDGGALSLGAENVSPLDGAEPTPPVAPESAELPRDSRALDEGLVGSGPLGSMGPPQPIVTGPPLKFISPAFERDPEFRTGAPAPPPPVIVKASEPIAPAPPPVIAKAPEPNAVAPLPPPPVIARASERIAAAPPPPPPVIARAPEPKAAQEPVVEKPVIETPSARRPEKRALKEMLGFVDAPAPRGAQTPRSPEIVPGRPDSPAAAPVSDSPRVAPAESVYEGSGLPDAEEEHIDEAPDPFAHDEEDALEPMEEVARPDSTDLFRNSPVFSAPAPAPVTSRPVPPPVTPRPSSRPLVSGRNTNVSTVLKALAADVTRLGVPEGQRAATRAALVGLARQFDEGTATWSSVRQTFVMALEFPALARLLIPSLVPYLDLE